MSKNPGRTLAQHLAPKGESSLFAVIDGASAPKLLMALHEKQPDYICLYRGELQPDMAEVAPYLIQLEHDDLITEWILKNGWGGHWGIFFQAKAGIKEMRRHLRRFLVVHDESAKPLLFRFYDPRVLRKYLPTCTPAELKEFFGNIESILLEDENPKNISKFRLSGDVLKHEVLAVAPGGEPVLV
jgi:hypothetical protein